MTRRKSPQGDYAVGYGRPPAHSRFKPGQSGNPAGRRKVPKNVGQIVIESLNKRVPVQENGRRQTMTVLEVILRKLIADAARGDHKSIKLMMELQARYSGSAETSINPDDLSAEDQEILARYLPNGFRKEPRADPSGGDNE